MRFFLYMMYEILLNQKEETKDLADIMMIFWFMVQVFVQECVLLGTLMGKPMNGLA